MRKLIMVLMAAMCAVMAGCTGYSGSLVSPPTVNEGEAAELVVIRESALYYYASSFVVEIDGIDTFALANGSYTIIKVKHGEHIVSSKPFETSIKRGESTIRVSIEPGQRKYAYLSPKGAPGTYVGVKEISRQEGEELMAKSERQS